MAEPHPHQASSGTRGEKDIKLTHEFLSLMLGVRRSGVTTALQELEKRGLIQHRRSTITIIDRSGLEKSSNGSYEDGA